MHACIAAYQTPFRLGPGTNLQDYIYVSNAADAHVLAAANLLTSQTAAGEAFFITNGEPVPLRDLCRAVWKEFGHVPRFEVGVPEGLAAWAAWAAEGASWVLGGAEAEFCRGLLSDACRDRYVCIHKARSVLGYRPRVGLDEGVRLSCQVCFCGVDMWGGETVADGCSNSRRGRVSGRRRGEDGESCRLCEGHVPPCKAAEQVHALRRHHDDTATRTSQSTGGAVIFHSTCSHPLSHQTTHIFSQLYHI
jgi:hypothetical protein